jgi:hypothetical protein
MNHESELMEEAEAITQVDWKFYQCVRKWFNTHETDESWLVPVLLRKYKQIDAKIKGCK